MLSKWVGETNPTAVVVDVSAEITQYLRFLGVPVIAVRQHGDRSDYPHLAGYDAAYKLLAPYPQILEPSGVPSWIQAKTVYVPGFSRYSERKLTRSAARKMLDIPPEQQVIIVINGKGGAKHSLAEISAAALETPEWLWLVVGKIDRNCDIMPNNVSIVGWCEDTYPYLKAADVAIASGGHNTVMEIGTAKIPFLCIPEDRPFDEQLIKAQLLEKLGLCQIIKTFPRKNSIKFVLSKLQELNPSQWSEIMAVDGSARAAKAIASEVRLLSGYIDRDNNDTSFKAISY